MRVSAFRKRLNIGINKRRQIMQKTDIGIIGLAVMGRSLALNMADHGFKVGGYNRSREVTENVIKEHPHKNLIPF